MSICIAAGTLGSPGMRMILPAIATIISAPALMTMSRTLKSNPLATQYSFGSVENENCVLAMQTGKRSKPSSYIICSFFFAAAPNDTDAAP